MHHLILVFQASITSSLQCSCISERLTLDLHKFVSLVWKFLWNKGSQDFIFYKRFKKLVHVSWDCFMEIAAGYTQQSTTSIRTMRLSIISTISTISCCQTPCKGDQTSQQESYLHQSSTSSWTLLNFVIWRSGTLLLVSQIPTTASPTTTDLPTTHRLAADWLQSKAGDLPGGDGNILMMIAALEQGLHKLLRKWLFVILMFCCSQHSSSELLSPMTVLPTKTQKHSSTELKSSSTRSNDSDSFPALLVSPLYQNL